MQKTGVSAVIDREVGGLCTRFAWVRLTGFQLPAFWHFSNFFYLPSKQRPLETPPPNTHTIHGAHHHPFPSDLPALTGDSASLDAPFSIVISIDIIESLVPFFFPTFTPIIWRLSFGFPTPRLADRSRANLPNPLPGLNSRPRLSALDATDDTRKPQGWMHMAAIPSTPFTS